MVVMAEWLAEGWPVMQEIGGGGWSVFGRCPVVVSTVEEAGWTVAAAACGHGGERCGGGGDGLEAGMMEEGFGWPEVVGFTVRRSRRRRCPSMVVVAWW